MVDMTIGDWTLSGRIDGVNENGLACYRPAPLEEKTRNGILCTPSVNPPRKQRMSFRQRSVTYVKSFLRAFTREKRYPTCFKFRFVSSPPIAASIWQVIEPKGLKITVRSVVIGSDGSPTTSQEIWQRPSSNSCSKMRPISPSRRCRNTYAHALERRCFSNDTSGGNRKLVLLFIL